MSGIMIPQRKNVEANENEGDDYFFQEKRSARDFIAELREKAEKKSDQSRVTGVKSEKDKEKMKQMLRQQRIRETIRGGNRKNRWEEDDKIQKLREKFKNR